MNARALSLFRLYVDTSLYMPLSLISREHSLSPCSLRSRSLCGSFCSAFNFAFLLGGSKEFIFHSNRYLLRRTRVSTCPSVSSLCLCSCIYMGHTLIKERTQQNNLTERCSPTGHTAAMLYNPSPFEDRLATSIADERSCSKWLEHTVSVKQRWKSSEGTHDSSRAETIAHKKCKYREFRSRKPLAGRSVCLHSGQWLFH